MRYYGFLSPSSAVPLEDVKARIELAHGFDVPAAELAPEPVTPLRCRHCGGVLRFRRLVLPGEVAIGSLGPPISGSSVRRVVPAGP